MTMIERRDLLAGMAAAGAGLAALPAMAAPAPRKAFRPGQLWPDTTGTHINAHGGGVLRHGDRWYWFGEHKVAGDAGNRAYVGVRCYSSANLHDWKDEGVALPVSADPASDIASGCIIERPKVIYNPRDRKFVMWFHLELKGQGYGPARAGVAVADTPAGPYRFLRSGRVNPGIWPIDATAADKAPDTLLARDFPGGQMARDMTLFVDDDGTGWHIYSSEENQTLQVARLAPDFLSHDGHYARILPGGSNEAPAIFKAQGRYWLFASGTTGWAPNPCRLFVADTITGPWEPLGNPVQGTAAQRATTFGGQSTFVLPLPPAPDGRPRAIFMADVWRPKNAIDGRYVWLPIVFQDGKPVLRWHESWGLEDA